MFSNNHKRTSKSLETLIVPHSQPLVAAGNLLTVVVVTSMFKLSLTINVHMWQLACPSQAH